MRKLLVSIHTKQGLDIYRVCERMKVAGDAIILKTEGKEEGFNTNNIKSFEVMDDEQGGID